MYASPSPLSKRYYNRYIANILNRSGVGAIAGCFAPPGVERSDEIDLSFTRQHGSMEILSRPEPFNNDPSSYPSEYVKLFTETEFINKLPRPIALILVSEATDCAVVLPMSSSVKWDTWIPQGSNERYLVAHKRLLRPFAEFIKWAKQREEKWQRQIAKMY